MVPDVVAAEDRDTRDAARRMTQGRLGYLSIRDRQQVQEHEQHHTGGGDQQHGGQEWREPTQPHGNEQLVEGQEQATELALEPAMLQCSTSNVFIPAQKL